MGVRATLPTSARVLRVGESLYGRITVAVHPGAVVVPAEALVPEGESVRLFVVDSAGIAHARTVSVGARAGGVAEITSGLRAGEVVVTYGSFGVEDGAKVVTVKP